MLSTAIVTSQVPNQELVGWRTRWVYCAMSVVFVCRGMRQREVAALFGEGLLCVRGYDPATGAPRPLPAWAAALPKAPPKPPGLPKQAAPGPASPEQPDHVASSGKKRGRPKKLREAALDGPARLVAAAGADGQPAAPPAGADALAIVASPGSRSAAGYWEGPTLVRTFLVQCARLCMLVPGCNA